MENPIKKGWDGIEMIYRISRRSVEKEAYYSHYKKLVEKGFLKFSVITPAFLKVDKANI